jgi:hypothetical protein
LTEIKETVENKSIGARTRSRDQKRKRDEEK